jgi:hypothetical protein
LAGFFLSALIAAARAAGPTTPASGELAQIGIPDAAEAQRILAQFRQSGMPGYYYLTFNLQHLPRRGAEQVFLGRLWGSRNAGDSLIRVVLTDGAGSEHRLLVQNGRIGAVWRWTAGITNRLGLDELFAPVVPGVQLSAFDLQMPFLAWPDATVVSINRVRGRPAHAFVFRPPTGYAAVQAAPVSVRSYFDAQFNAPMQTEWLDRDGKVTRTFSLLDLKKVEGTYLPKAFEVRDEATRDKTRLVVTGAALNLDLSAALFEPAMLGEDFAPPAASRIIPFNP